MSKNTKKIDLDYELGNMVGEFIIYKFLPTLSTDMLKSMNVIAVPLELEREWAKKQKEYRALGYNESKDSESSKLFYRNLAWYKENIESIYLPQVLECRIPKFQYKNEAKFIEGLKSALWDCDMSHYDVKDIEIITGEGWWCTDVKLKYSK